MTDAANKTTTEEQPASERRSNVVLRSLVNEMLQRVRDLSRRTAAWSVEERAQAEAELERIMSRVRDEASRSRATR
ncbi:MAG TPA: hypothetical protein VJO52_01095 [Gemmatimonadaceae bacterium]|nr:hypothetical protein [Gemmatimonadaceae bacterium]